MGGREQKCPQLRITGPDKVFKDKKLLHRVGKQIDQIDTGGLLGRVKAHLRLDMSPGGISLSYCTFSTKILLLEYRH